MKRLVAASAIALSALFGGAQAADLGVAPLYKASQPQISGFSWTGLYVGGNIGYGWAAHSFDILPVDPNSQAFFALLGNPGSLDQTTKGVVGGGQVGYNLQFGQWVLGTEFLFDWTNMRSAASQTAMFGALPVATLSSGVRVDWDGAINAKIGFTPAPRWLISAFGGFAFGNISDNAAVTCIVACGPFGFSNGSSNVHGGWDLGAQVDWAFMNNIVASASYRYVDLGNHSLLVSNGGAPPATFNANDSARWNEVLFKLNFLLN